MQLRQKGFLVLTFLLSPSLLSAAEPQSSQTPVTITDQDLASLSPQTRKEIETLIQQKRENPERPPTEVRFGRGRGIVDGHVGPGGVNIKLLGGAINIGGRRRPVPVPVAAYHPAHGHGFPDDLIVTMVKRGNQPMMITVEKGGVSFTIPGEKLEQMIDKYKPYVVQMLQQGLEQSGESSTVPSETPSIDLGAPATELGTPAELPGPELGNPAPIPEPAPLPGTDETPKE